MVTKWVLSGGGIWVWWISGEIDDKLMIDQPRTQDVKKRPPMVAVFDALRGDVYLAVRNSFTGLIHSLKLPHHLIHLGYILCANFFLELLV